MGGLVDTHAFLWFIAASTRLGDSARRAIERQEGATLVSMALLWEMALKISLGKLDVGEPSSDLLRHFRARSVFEVLPIRLPHLVELSMLPMTRHRDPFDRLLVSQCLVEQLPIISAERAFDAYGVRRIW